MHESRALLPAILQLISVLAEHSRMRLEGSFVAFDSVCHQESTEQCDRLS